jgi:hypothetical protein
LTRWDAGPRPLVVDRLALEEAGLGPATPFRVGITPADGTPASAWDAYRLLGLTLEPREEFLLVTTPRSRVENRTPAVLDGVRTAVRLAAGRGSDPTDCFQSVVRWNAALSPLAGPEAAGNWVGTTRGIMRPGNPGDGIALERLDPRSRWATRLALALAILLAGRAIRRWSRAGRVRCLAVIAAGAALAYRWSPDLAIGLSLGALACLGFWIGPALRRRPAGRNRDRTTGSASVATASLLIGFLAVAPLGVNLMGDEPAAAPPGPSEDVIVAVSTADEPATVVITRADDDRLRAWAGLAAGPGPESTVTATDVEHRIGRRSGTVVSVESRFALVLEGDSPAAWELPLGSSREVTGELDDHPIAPDVQPGGRAFRVWVQKPGRHTLVVRRQVDLEPRDGGFDLDLPVNPVATALVTCTTGDDRPELTGARGALRSGPEGQSVGLGPGERLQARWSPAGGGRTEAPRIMAEGLLLWDAGPAGDGVHARFTYRTTRSISEIRVRVGSGVIVRSAQVPNLVDTRFQEGSPGKTWIAHVDPPLSGAISFQLDLWQSRKRGGGPRVLPRIEPVGVDVAGWILGFRRPGSWTGRLGPTRGAETVSDETFARTWGPFPEPSATFAGAIRTAQLPRVEVVTGPAPVRATVRPRVVVKVEPGRLLVTAEAGITEQEGQLRELAVRIPDDWRVIRVGAEGLTSWSRTGPGELRLRFDGVGTGLRRVRLEGWIPIDGDPHRAPGTMTTPLPWPTWSGLQSEAGELHLLAPRGLGVRLSDAASGVTPIAARRGAPADPVPADLSYRVEPIVTALGALTWTEPASYTKVAVDKLLTAYPAAAVLAASLDYQVQGGPLHSITFSLPQTWSSRARVALDGVRHAIQKDDREGVTFWTLRLERPVWGSLRVRIESERPSNSAGDLSVPEILPRGRGEITSFLALANATGNPLITEGEGIAAIEATSPRIEALLPFQGIPYTTYRITRDGWRLSVRQPPESPATAGVSLADHTAVVAPDGSSWGLSRFDVGAGMEPLLSLRFPAGAEVLGTLVDGLPVRALRDRSGGWFLPVPDGTANHAEVVWKRGPATVGRDGTSELLLPCETRSRAPTIVTIFAPERGSVRVSGPRLAEASGVELELDRVGARAREVMDRANRLDRSSAADRSRMLGALIQFELACRTAERAARFTSPTTALGLASLQRLHAIRSHLEDSLRVAGLSEYAQSAQYRVGGIPAADGPVSAEEPVLPPSLTLPQLGTPRMFRSPGLSAQDAPVLRWQPARDEVLGIASHHTLLSLGLASLLLVAGLSLARAADRLRADWVRACAIGLGVLGLVVVPLAGAVFLAALASGCLDRPRAGADSVSP